MQNQMLKNQSLDKKVACLPAGKKVGHCGSVCRR